MNSRRLGLIVALALWASPGASQPLQPVEPVMRGLAQRLRANGRAEVKIEKLSLDPISGRTEALRGVLILEPPDRAALEFPMTGERVTMRADGGEWLQPELRQMIRLSAGDAAGALRWWDLLLHANSSAFGARRAGDRRWRLVAHATDGLAADSANIVLGPDGLPLRLEIEQAPAPRAMYRFRDWKFSHAQGRAAFVIQPPRDFEVVRLR